MNNLVWGAFVCCGTLWHTYHQVHYRLVIGQRPHFAGVGGAKTLITQGGQRPAFTGSLDL